MKHQQIQKLEETRKNFTPINNINTKYKNSLSLPDKLALWITNHVGSMVFFFLIFIWTITWLSWNTLAPIPLRFDPFPAFVLWLFISNMIQIFLMPLIMVGQNLQSKHAELRAEENFKVNKKSETEVEIILRHLEHQNEMILEILTKIEQMEKNK
ncbi:MAG: DUF1003 domain-containing protein [Sphingobacteriales bacterium]|nr:DUF1003 domain-containing protein [Sphingobacteriales bacterium]